ncbi:MAG: hypothetical protein M1554_03255 [Patescibacteria group bacterium]|nr:hypothetical protein [Patescibacteria group bacterium]
MNRILYKPKVGDIINERIRPVIIEDSNAVGRSKIEAKIKLINQQLKTVIALLSKIDKGLYVIVPKSASIMASAISEVK